MPILAGTEVSGRVFWLAALYTFWPSPAGDFVSPADERPDLAARAPEMDFFPRLFIAKRNFASDQVYLVGFTIVAEAKLRDPEKGVVRFVDEHLAFIICW